MAGNEPVKKKPGDFQFADEINLINERLANLENITGGGQIEVFKSGKGKAFGLSRSIPDIAFVEMFENMPAGSAV